MSTQIIQHEVPGSSYKNPIALTEDQFHASLDRELGQDLDGKWVLLPIRRGVELEIDKKRKIRAWDVGRVSLASGGHGQIDQGAGLYIAEQNDRGIMSVYPVLEPEEHEVHLAA